MNAPSSAESTATLLSLLRRATIPRASAWVARYLPMLRRWAHGRLPQFARI